MEPHGKNNNDVDDADVDDLMDAIFGDDDQPENDSKLDDDDEDLDNSESDEGDNDEQEDTDYNVAEIDPDSVDFEPLFQDHSSVPLNYHDVSHGNTEHHRLLNEKNGFVSISKCLEPDPKHSLKDQLQTCFRSVTKGITLRHLRPKSSKKHMKEETAYMLYVAVGMLAFIFYVLYSHMSEASDTLHINGKVVAKSLDGAFHHSATKIYVSHAPDDTPIPIEYDAYRDVDDLPLGIMDTPIYWHIPRSGGTTMKLIMSMCMGRVVACEQGAGHQLDERLEIISKAFGNFANVDTSTPLGIERAAEMGLIPARMVDVVITSHIRKASQLFDVHHKGRLFAMFRHPIDRIVSLYYFLKMPDQQAAVGLDVNDMSLEKFATDFSENWMVRSLVGAMVGPIDQSHLDVAKQILKKKFFIGLLEEKTESLRRIGTYFGWRLPSRVAQTCKNNMFYFEPQSKNLHPAVETTSEEYESVLAVNVYDIQLYEYAKFLFEAQAPLISK